MRKLSKKSCVLFILLAAAPAFSTGAGTGADAASDGAVCGKELAHFVNSEMRPYVLTVIRSQVRQLCGSYGFESDTFFRLYSADDIYQDIEIGLMKSRFNPSHHGDTLELTTNNHLKTWIKKLVRWRISQLIRWTMRNEIRRFTELPQTRRHDGGWQELDVVDPTLPASVLDIVAEAHQPGDHIPSFYPSAPQEAGISEETWDWLLGNGQRWVEAACQAQEVSPTQFWAHEGGLFTAGDFAEELLEQAIVWRRKFGAIDRQQAVNVIVEITAQRMVEELTGVALVRERALKWMQQSGKKSAQTAAENFRINFIEGMPIDRQMEAQGISKALASFRKKSGQETFLDYANILVQYPPHLSWPTNGDTIYQLPDDEYLGLIVIAEGFLKSTGTQEKRRLVAGALQRSLQSLGTRFTVSPLEELEAAKVKRLVKRAVDQALAVTP